MYVGMWPGQGKAKTSAHEWGSESGLVRGSRVRHMPGMARQGYGDKQRPGWDVGTWVDLAWQGPWLGRAAGSWRPALLQCLWGRDWWPLGTKMGSWAVGRVGGDPRSLKPISALKSLSGTYETFPRDVKDTGWPDWYLLWKATSQISSKLNETLVLCCFFLLNVMGP